MTLPKKKSRILTVDNVQYRCVIGPNDGYNVFYAEIEDENKGCIIEVYFDTEINKFWIEFPYVSNLNLKILKPKDFEIIIRQALVNGWNPKEKGQNLRFDFVDNTLIKSKQRNK